MVYPVLRLYILLIVTLIALLVVSAVSASCSVNGTEIYGLVRYLVGQPRARGSIYAVCDNGTATCYQDDGVYGAPHPQVSCTLEKHGRALGVYAMNTPWPHRVVCLKWTKPMSSHMKWRFDRAFTAFREKAGFTFLSIDRCRNFYGKDTRVCNNCQTSNLITESASRCAGSTGMIDKPFLNLTDGACSSAPNLGRAFGHMVGLDHEHVHPKRKVIVVREKMIKGVHTVQDYVAVHKGDGRYAMDTYDPMSIMHYPHSGDVLCLPKDTTLMYCDLTQTKVDWCVVPKIAHCDLEKRYDFGQASELRAGDIAALKKLYENETTLPTSQRVPKDAPYMGPPQVQSLVPPGATRPPRAHAVDRYA
ncbi:hypothetical protein Poli38472_007729 [Pythium oligandrum]|uniref:Peptidase M12A domain-containing protein n=1 Tax=Pythium oligandrum TaxID=41045 RepID=A0A8K1FQL0_PYTOL|nr:hypothetical protein Poli38472_007729 [Pythium oligandrum]|eukprot:TMW68057.1 hypothetical protein Poli38472_007729 [Pythium oligandrum]